MSAGSGAPFNKRAPDQMPRSMASMTWRNRTDAASVTRGGSSESAGTAVSACAAAAAAAGVAMARRLCCCERVGMARLVVAALSSMGAMGVAEVRVFGSAIRARIFVDEFCCVLVDELCRAVVLLLEAE